MFRWLANLFRRPEKASAPKPAPAPKAPAADISQLPNAPDPTPEEVAPPEWFESEPAPLEESPLSVAEPESEEPVPLGESRCALVAGALEVHQLPIIRQKLSGFDEIFAVDTVYEAKRVISQFEFQRVLVFEEGPFIDVEELRSILRKSERCAAAPVEVVPRRARITV